MALGGTLRSKGSRFGRWGLCAGLLTSFACDQVTANDRGVAERKAKAEQAAEQERIDAEEQAERDRAVAAIEDDRGDPPRPLETEEVEGILAYYCGGCHGSEEQGFEQNNLIFDTVDDLLAKKTITPGDSVTSRVMERIRAGDDAYLMPPTTSGIPSVPPATAQLLADFIDSLPPEAGD